MYIYTYTYMYIFVEASVDVGCAAGDIGVLQCVAVFCIVLHWSLGWSWNGHQDSAVCCRVVQSDAVWCTVLQCVAVCCSVVQRVALCCSVLQCVAVCCSVLHSGAVWCSVLQCVAVCCSMLYMSKVSRAATAITTLVQFISNSHCKRIKLNIHLYVYTWYTIGMMGGTTRDVSEQSYFPESSLIEIFNFFLFAV